jgi:hypothetical protein
VEGDGEVVMGRNGNAHSCGYHRAYRNLGCSFSPTGIGVQNGRLAALYMYDIGMILSDENSRV